MPKLSQSPSGMLVTAVGLVVVFAAILGLVILKSQELNQEPLINQQAQSLEATPTAIPTLNPTQAQPTSSVSAQTGGEAQLDTDFNTLEKDSARLDQALDQVNQGLNDQSDNLNE